MVMNRILLVLLTLCFWPLALSGQQQSKFSYLDVFKLNYVTDPQISPDGAWIVYRRMGFDIMKDRSAGNLWMIRTDGRQHQKLTAREGNEFSPKRAPRFIYTGRTPVRWQRSLNCLLVRRP